MENHGKSWVYRFFRVFRVFRVLGGQGTYVSGLLWGCLKTPVLIVELAMQRLPAEAIKGAALPLERVHDVHGRDGLPASVLGVGHCIADDVL